MALAIPKLLAALPFEVFDPFNKHSGLKRGWRVTLANTSQESDNVDW